MNSVKIKSSDKTNLTVLLEKGYYKYLQKLSFELSAKEGKRVALGEVVRRALEDKYPIPEDQLELF